MFLKVFAINCCNRTKSKLGKPKWGNNSFHNFLTLRRIKIVNGIFVSYWFEAHRTRSVLVRIEDDIRSRVILNFHLFLKQIFSVFIFTIKILGIMTIVYSGSKGQINDLLYLLSYILFCAWITVFFYDGRSFYSEYCFL